MVAGDLKLLLRTFEWHTLTCIIHSAFIIDAENNYFSFCTSVSHALMLQPNCISSRSFGDFMYKQNVKLPADRQIITGTCCFNSNIVKLESRSWRVVLDVFLYISASTIWFSAMPEIQETSLSGDEDFVIIACDGVWGPITSQEAVDFIMEQYVTSWCHRPTTIQSHQSCPVFQAVQRSLLWRDSEAAMWSLHGPSSWWWQHAYRYGRNGQHYRE